MRKVWRGSLISVLSLIAACGGADGKDGTNGSNGTNGTNGTPGANGNDGTNGVDGTYVYTFTATIAAANGFDPSLTHRLAIQLSGRFSGETDLTPVGNAPPVNFTHDFVPNGAPVTTTREIVDVNNCNQCHGQLTL